MEDLVELLLNSLDFFDRKVKKLLKLVDNLFGRHEPVFAQVDLVILEELLILAVYEIGTY